MKKSDVINLIKYHYQNENEKFYNQAFDIAKDFEDGGETILAQYIESILSKNYNLIPQTFENESIFLKQSTFMKNPLYLPDSINNDIVGIVNSIKNGKPVNKFLFTGFPGTGKTEVAKHIANLTKRDLLSVNFTSLMDSRLGETLKNIEKMFATINNTLDLDNTIILFDEVDIIALDRINKNDLREMGRATSLFIKCLDSLNPKAIVIATTNLDEKLDRAILRRFDYTVNFDVYSKSFLSEIAVAISREFLQRKNKVCDDMLQKIIMNYQGKISPAEIRNIIKISVAFSDNNNPFDYLKRVFSKLYNPELLNDSAFLYNNLHFTYREIETLSGIPKSTAQRMTIQGR